MFKNVVVIQPLPGIGDMIWLTPHVRAIAAYIGGPVTLVAKARAAASQIFMAEDSVRDVIEVGSISISARGRHNGENGLLRLIHALRDRQFEASYLLHHSKTMAFASWAAGIPVRYGYGAGMQRFWLNQPVFLTRAQRRLNRFQQATAWLQKANVRMPELEPRLILHPDARARVEWRLSSSQIVPVTLGIGSSELYKQWGAERFASLIHLLYEAGWTRVILLGGPPQTSLAKDIVQRIHGTEVEILIATDCSLSEAAALLNASAFYVGNDTGFLNMAAALGIRSYGLFGATHPFFHLRQVVPITPPDDVSLRGDGMARITPLAVLATINADQQALAARRIPGSGGKSTLGSSTDHDEL